MAGQTVILYGPSQRAYAASLIELAPDMAVLNIKEAKRTLSQNDKMWAMLSDISRAKPQDRVHKTERWKAIFMESLGHEIEYEFDLEGKQFPIGHSTSNLTKAQMADLIELMYAYGALHGVVWTEPKQDAA